MGLFWIEKSGLTIDNDQIFLPVYMDKYQVV